MADKKVNEFYTRPPVLSRWEGFQQFLWNPDTKQFLGRTGASWGKILLFYLIFYAALVGFFAALLAVFYQTLDSKKPKWELDNGLIGNNPGLGFRPMPPESNVESTLIWYKSSDKGNVHYWQKELRNFLKTYNKENNPHYNNVEQCSMFVSPTPGKVCDVKMSPQKWHPCLDEAGFGFEDDKGGPCIFLKLNKIYNWYPEYYNSTNLPDSSIMSEYIRKDIIEAEGRNEHQMVWVTCEGENPADKENIGPLRYIPQRGFSSQYFPFKNQDGYLSPLVAVHFESPKLRILEVKLTIAKLVAWSDSEIALGWIKSSPHRWKTFVSNRVAYIQERISPDNWFCSKSRLFGFKRCFTDVDVGAIVLVCWSQVPL